MMIGADGVRSARAIDKTGHSQRRNMACIGALSLAFLVTLVAPMAAYAQCLDWMWTGGGIHGDASDVCSAQNFSGPIDDGTFYPAPGTAQYPPDRSGGWCSEDYNVHNAQAGVYTS